MQTQKRDIDPILRRMGEIERMERGKICKMKGRPHYNHQTWQDGKNVVRYVPEESLDALQQAIDGYRLFMQLAEEYASKVILRTRNEAQSKNHNE